MKKRLLPALLALVMVLGMFPLAAFATQGDTLNTVGVARPNADAYPDYDAETHANGPWKTVEVTATEGTDAKNVNVTVKVTGLEKHGAVNTDASAGNVNVPSDAKYLIGLSIPMAAGDEGAGGENEKSKVYYAGWGETASTSTAVVPDGYYQGKANFYFGLENHIDSNNKAYIVAGTDTETAITYAITFSECTLAEEITEAKATLDLTEMTAGANVTFPVPELTSVTVGQNSATTEAADIAKIASVEATWVDEEGAKATAPTKAGTYTATVKLVPEKGYQLLDAENLKMVDDQGNALTQLKLTVVAPKFALSVASAITGGTVTISPSAGNVEAGTKITVTATPTNTETDEVKTVTYTSGGNTVTVNKDQDGNYTFVMPEADAEVSATFGTKTVKYTVTVTAPATADGTLAADKTEAAEGDTVTVTATAAEGKKVTGVTVTDADDGDVAATKDAQTGKYTFTMPAKNVTVSATFADDDGGNTPTPPTGDDNAIEGSVTGTGDDAVLAPTENAVKDSVADQVADASATEVNITVTAPAVGADDVTKTNVPLNAATLTALDEAASKSVVIDTPQGGVTMAADKLVEKTGTEEAVTFKMENTSTAATVETYAVGFYDDNDQEIDVELPSKVITLTFKTNFTAGDKVDVLADGKLVQANVVVDSDKAVTVASSHLSSWELRKVAGASFDYYKFNDTGSDSLTYHQTPGYVKVEKGATTYGAVVENDYYLVQIKAGSSTLLSFIKAGSTGLVIPCNKSGVLSVWQLSSSEPDVTTLTGAELQNKQVITDFNLATLTGTDHVDP